ncbi:MAG: LacI family transcriptional regulator [Ramlibacter sp.]|nr:LacI family transcriptional regulator [Ramlibacter sp.]
MSNRELSLALVKKIFLLLACSASLCVQAQNYPDKPVRLIVPFGAGTPPDYLARLTAEKLSRSMGQQFVVDNRPGANSLVGLGAASKADADGYTIVYSDLAGLAINPSLYPKLPYDPKKDFAPVAMAFSTPLYVIVGGKSPYKSLREFINAAKSGSSRLSYGSIGNGSVIHLATEEFKSLSGIEMVHVPFKGADFVPALIRGDVDVMFLGIGAVAGLVASGQLRPLAIASKDRSAYFSNVPTVSEAGGPAGFNSHVWSAFIVPARTPRSVVERLNSEINKALALPDMKADLARLDFVPIGGAPELVTKAMTDDAARYAELIRTTGAKID